jgi:hypothetical protein
LSDSWEINHRSQSRCRGRKIEQIIKTHIIYS